MPERYVKQIRCGIDNCFVVRQGDNAILVDTGRKSHRQKVLDIARKENISLVFLTHGHYDHVCNAAAIAKKLNIPVAMHASDVDLIADNHLQRMHARTLFGHILLAYCHNLRRNPRIDSFTPDIYLQEGDSLKEFGINARVLELPGHTLGSIGLDVWGTDVLVGDACTNVPGPGRAPFYGNHDVMLKTCRKIEQLGARIVHVGHGNSLANRTW